MSRKEKTYLLTPWSRVILEKLSGFQLVKKFPAFYGTWRFITTFTGAHHLSLSWASLIKSIPPHPTSWRSILILSSHLCLGLPNGLLSLRPPYQNPVYTCPLPHSCYMSHPSHSSWFYRLNNIGWGVHIINFLVPNIELSWRAVRVFKSAAHPNASLSWRKCVSNLEGLFSPLHVAQLYFFKS